MARTGRPRVKIDKGKLEGMVMYGATCLDCAGIFDCSEDSIVKFIKRKYHMNFKEYSDKKQANIRIRLRQKQIEMALNGNVAMLVWTGKNILGQSDQQSITQTSNIVQLKYSFTGTPDELRTTIKTELATEITASEGTSETQGHT